MRRGALALLISAIALLVGCGGGSSGGSTSSSSKGAFTITTPQQLPATLQGQHYSTTLAASGGSGALTWSMAPVSSFSLFPTGLSIDVGTGIVSGTANFAGTAGFVATAYDSANHSVSKTLLVTAYSQLTAGTMTPLHVNQYQLVPPYSGQLASGGFPPLLYRVTTGPMPAGLHLNSATGQFSGTVLNAGTFPLVVTVQDSWSTPEAVTVPVTVTVTPPPLALANSLPARLLLNQPFSGKLVATGGLPPYTFAMNGTLPAGLTFDPSSGTLSGTPTTIGSSFPTGMVTDSSVPPANAYHYFQFQVVQPLGRNDSVATATAVGNGFVSATLSPYEDPPTAAPLAADHDFYKIVAQGGQVVHVETTAARYNTSISTDTVLEVLDANSTRLNTCRQPGDTSTTFASVCVNDDISTSPHVTDSALDVQVPGPATATTAIYVDVLDWAGRARPDMSYSLSISGALAPLQLQPVVSPLWGFVGETGKTWKFNATGGGVPYTWTLATGSLPPGFTLSSDGVISGTPTTAGSYSFILQLTDMLGQILTQPVTFNIAEPLAITSTSPLPDATAGVQYSYQLTSSGGASPYSWGVDQPSFFYGALNVSPTGVLSGKPPQAGVYTLTIRVFDQSQQSASKDFSFTVHPGTVVVQTQWNSNNITAFAGSSINFPLQALYGTPPYTFSVSSGALPPGVTLTSAGVLWGTTTAKGTYTFTVTATDSSTPQLSGTGTFVLTVN